MASYPAPTQASLSVFNPSNFDTTYDADTIDYADTRYFVKSQGGTVSGSTTFSSSLKAGTGYSSSVTYTLLPGSTFSTSQKKFGSYSLYVPYVNNGGMGITGMASSNFSAAMTFEFWYYPVSIPTTPGSTSYLLNSFVTGSDNAYVRIYLQTGGTLGYECYNGTTTAGGTLSASVTTGTWHHISIGCTSSGVWWGAYDGTWASSGTTSVISSSLLAQGFVIGNGYRQNSSASTAWTDASFSSPANGYFDEIRISKSQRYTTSFTPSTSAFSSDTNTVFLHHCENSLVNSTSQETPTPTSTTSVFDSSGNVDILGNLTSSVGSISLTSGDLKTTYGQVQSYRFFGTTNAGWGVGANSLLNATTVGATSTVGAYIINSPGWTSTASTSHIIPASMMLLNPSNTNVVGRLVIYYSDKVSSGTGKMGMLECHVMLQYGTTAFTLNTVATTKSSNLTTLSAAASGMTIVVSCDSGKISWSFFGAV